MDTLRTLPVTISDSPHESTLLVRTFTEVHPILLFLSLSSTGGFLLFSSLLFLTGTLREGETLWPSPRPVEREKPRLLSVRTVRSERASLVMLGRQDGVEEAGMYPGRRGGTYTGRQGGTYTGRHCLVSHDRHCLVSHDQHCLVSSQTGRSRL